MTITIDSKEYKEAFREYTKAVQECGIPPFVASHHAAVLACASCCIEDSKITEFVIRSARVLIRLWRKHFSDHSGYPTLEEKKAFLRELYAHANKAVNGDPAWDRPLNLPEIGS